MRINDDRPRGRGPAGGLSAPPRRRTSKTIARVHPGRRPWLDRRRRVSRAAAGEGAGGPLSGPQGHRQDLAGRRLAGQRAGGPDHPGHRRARHPAARLRRADRPDQAGEVARACSSPWSTARRATSRSRTSTSPATTRRSAASPASTSRTRWRTATSWSSAACRSGSTSSGINGFDEAIAGSDIKVLDNQFGNWNRDDAFKVMQDFLTKYPEDRRGVGQDDDMAVGVLRGDPAGQPHRHQVRRRRRRHEGHGQEGDGRRQDDPGRRALPAGHGRDGDGPDRRQPLRPACRCAAATSWTPRW